MALLHVETSVTVHCRHGFTSRNIGKYLQSTWRHISKYRQLFTVDMVSHLRISKSSFLNLDIGHEYEPVSSTSHLSFGLPSEYFPRCFRNKFDGHLLYPSSKSHTAGPSGGVLFVIICNCKICVHWLQKPEGDSKQCTQQYKTQHFKRSSLLLSSRVVACL
jgi:hypothetical protein